MRLKTLDRILNEVLAGWRRGLGTGDHDTLTQLMEDGDIADDVIELREDIANSVFINKSSAADVRAGSVEEFSVGHLLRVGIEEVVAAHKIVEAMRMGTPVAERADLQVDPERYYYDGEIPPKLHTGILVRAKDPDNRYSNYDIGQLTLDSLIGWLRSSGQIAPLAENTLAIVLGHDLRSDDNRKGKNGRGPQEWQKEQDDAIDF